MAAATATLTPNTSDADRAAAQLAAQGVPIAQICARFDPLISPQTVRAAIARGRHALDQERPKPVPPATTTPKPTVVLEPDSLEELLAWADKHGGRAASLAGRINGLAADLRLFYRNAEAEAEARAEVARLSKALDDAKTRLRTLGGSSGPGAAKSRSGQDLGAVRTWARANGHDVNDRGRVPADVLAAYQAAHAA